MNQNEFLVINVLQKPSVGEVIFVCVPNSLIRHGWLKKKNSWSEEEKELGKMWKRALKCYLLKKGTKTLNSALSVAWIFHVVFKRRLLQSQVNSTFQFHYFACYRFKNVCYPYPFIVSQYPKPRYNPWLQSWVLCVSICGVWIWYEHMVSLVLASK